MNSRRIFRFGVFEADLDTRELRKHDRTGNQSPIRV